MDFYIRNVYGSTLNNIREPLNTPTNNRKEENDGDRVLIRDPVFARFFRPFGLPQHVFYRLFYSQAHAFALYYVLLFLQGKVERTIYLIPFLYSYVGALGITVGCHRYWTHRTFKANKPVQVFLMICQTIALQFPIFTWTLYHRLHHKYTDTNCDPHNSKRGLYFSHIGWKFLPKHPEYKRKLQTFPMPDIENDPIVRFQSKYYWTLALFFRFAIPILGFCYYYDLEFLPAVACNYCYYLVALHLTFTVNSVAHKWGDKPFDKNISAADNWFVSAYTVGEGWHNFHHTFPWDYKAGEYGWKFNISTMLIDFFALFGWVWDLKTVSPELVEKRRLRTGIECNTDTGMIPSSESLSNGKIETHHLWGWDDDNMTEDLKSITKILRQKRST